MQKIKWADENVEPFRFHVGMRTAKTVVAVFLCALTGQIRGEVPIFAMFAAVLCLQNSTGETLLTAFNRVLGTLIGGFFGVLLVYISIESWVEKSITFYYLLVSVALIPIISVTLLLKKPSVTALACVVFLSTTISQAENGVPLYYALQRIIDTMVGIVVTVGVELLLPYHNKKCSEQAQESSVPSAAPQEESGPSSETEQSKSK